MTNALEDAPAPDVVAGDGYNEQNVDVLRDAKHIRQNPGMYIGNTHAAGLHHLVYELVHNSVDEALAGFCKNIRVVVHLDGSLSVIDDGRGIPVEEHPKEKRPTLEVVLTVVGAGAKFDNKAYRVSAGLHGMGAKAVTALSEWTVAEIRRNGRTWKQEYSRGYATTPVHDIGAATRSGTRITFKPDPEIFTVLDFDYATLETRLRELAFLNQGLAIVLLDERTGKQETFHYEGGVGEFVAWMNRDENVECKPISFVKVIDDIQVEVGLQYYRGEAEQVRCFANNAYNPEGGTHLSGFRAGLTRTIGAYGKKEGLFKTDIELDGKDFREGLTAVVNIQHPDPLFESQMKVRLTNPEVEGIVTSTVIEFLGKYLEENPKESQRIVKHVQLAAEARIAAKKARENVTSRKNILSGGGLPGKLMDCTSRNREESELFLVEGDSAGGSAESGRERYYQAVLPLRGKPLNVEKAKVEKMLDNNEIVSIISALGVDVGNAEDLSKLRYGKIIILTDADVDGQHIRTLLLTFFFRQMRKLIEQGHIYVARPPLFKVSQKKTTRFAQTEEDLVTELKERGTTGTVLNLLSEQASGKFEGDRLNSLVEILEEVDRSLIILERRGRNLAFFKPLMKDNHVPVFKVLLAGKERWFHTEEEVDAFRLAEQKRLGKELVVAESATTSLKSNGDDATVAFSVEEFHELDSLNRSLNKLKEFKLGVDDLLPLPRIAGREPPLRYTLVNGESTKALVDLRELPVQIRMLGTRGLTITRFKGLGEMNATELWDTTLDPTHRTLLRITLSDAFEADKWFRILMGEESENRRKFIEEEGLRVRDKVGLGD